MNQGAINLGNPVSSSPLNRGLVSWWLALPQRMGGGRFLDLCDKNHGTLTNGPTWSSGTPGGCGCLAFDGSDDYVALPGSLFDSNTLALSMWARTDVVDSTQALFSLYTAGFNNLEIYVDTSNSRLKYGTRDSPRTSADNAIAAGEWRHLVLSLNAGTAQLYVNGLASGTAGGAFISTFTTAALLCQRQSTAFFTGRMGDVRAYRRALSADEAISLYNDSRTGYPQTLNRLPRRSYAVAGGGGGFQSAWASGSNQVIQPWVAV